MALVFDEFLNSPQTHVLIIGVSEYMYLKDGKKVKLQEFDFVADLKQLTSTSASAKLFTEEVLNLHQNSSWCVPLGTVDLLEGEFATRNHIEDRYHEWRERCEANKDNVAVFYFAGHGFYCRGNQYLLPADFGASANNPWAKAIDFTQTRMAFQSCTAKTQLFFIDACRTIPLEALLSSFNVGSIDVIHELHGACDHELTLISTSVGSSAYGRENEPSFFTKALVNGLTGYAAMNVDDDWVISTSTLSTKMNEWVKMEMDATQLRQVCHAQISDPINIVKLSEAPKAKLLLLCSPNEALPLAKLRCYNASFQEERAPLSDPWSLDLRAGIYNLSAEFSNNEYSSTGSEVAVSPPFLMKTLKCQKN